METISNLKSAIKELEIGLLKLNKPTYDTIDALMRKIMKKYNLTAKQLHYGFKKTHNNKTPDDWIKGEKRMKTFQEFIEEAYTIAEGAAEWERKQANKKARGRKGRTPLYTTRTSTVPGRVEKTPEGWRLTKKPSKVTDKAPSIAASLGKFRSRGGELPSVQGGGHGGSGFGYGPKEHSTGGRHRGVKKKEQKPVPEPRYNKYQRRRAVAQSKRLRTGGEISSHLIGSDAAERLQAQAKKSFGAASKSWSEKEKAPKKKSAKERMAAAAERLGLKD